MKAKKAVKRLGKAEAILSNVIHQYSAQSSVRELLDSAKTNVARAKAAVDSTAASAKAGKKPPAKADKSRRGGLTAEGRKKLSIAAKKRWAAARRKGVNAVTGQPLRKTA
jgi:Spy/CpxP family protein refolding chaperone